MKKIASCIRIVSCCTLVLLSAETRAQIVGTLFTEPDEREYLDYLRREFMRANAADTFDVEDVVIPDIPDEVIVEEATGPQEYNFGGVMARSDGVRVWLNGSLLAESELPEGFSVVESGRSFALSFVRDGNALVLLPGQTVDVTTGTVIENFQRTQAEVSENTPLISEVPANVSPEEDVAPSAGSAAGETETSVAATESVNESSSAASLAAAVEADDTGRATELAETISEMNSDDVNALLEALQQMQDEEEPEPEDEP